MVLLVLFLAAGFCFEQYQRNRVRAIYPPSGRIIDVGTRNVHVVEMGTGTPTVVFESGLGSAGTEAWSLVQPRVAKFARTISYDRPGFLWSDSARTDRDSVTITNELLELLEHIEAPLPCIIVGHSMGGIHARVFANRHPDLVAGLVLVDASHPEQESRLPQELILEPPAWQLYGFRLIANLGLFRFVDVTTHNVRPSEKQQQIAFNFFPSHVHAICSEIRSQARNFQQARDTEFGSLPIRIVTAGQHHPEWHTLQSEILELSTNTKQTIAWNSDHRIPWRSPDVITQQIVELIEHVQE